MTKTSPGSPVLFISMLLVGAGVATRFGYLGVLSPVAFWLVVAGFTLLWLGVVLRGR